eukprot:622163-Pelagomonas_calceolata.AAC.3
MGEHADVGHPPETVWAQKEGPPSARPCCKLAPSLWHRVAAGDYAAIETKTVQVVGLIRVRQTDLFAEQCTLFPPNNFQRKDLGPIFAQGLRQTKQGFVQVAGFIPAGHMLHPTAPSQQLLGGPAIGTTICKSQVVKGNSWELANPQARSLYGVKGGGLNPPLAPACALPGAYSKCQHLSLQALSSRWKALATACPCLHTAYSAAWPWAGHPKQIGTQCMRPSCASTGTWPWRCVEPRKRTRKKV